MAREWQRGKYWEEEEEQEGEGEEENKVAWFINNSIWSRTFVERHLRRRSRFFPVSSRYRLHFTPPISGARASQRLCLRYFSFGYAFGIVIYFLPACLSVCLSVSSLRARLRHPREEIWRGKRTFHNHYRVLKGPSFVAIRDVNFLSRSYRRKYQRVPVYISFFFFLI